jgi:hypothetical protein
VKHEATTEVSADREEKRFAEWKTYAREYSRWFNSQPQESRARLTKLGLDKCLPYERARKRNEDDESTDPATYAVDPRDPRVPTLDFSWVGQVSPLEVQRQCDRFRCVLVWAAGNANGSRPGLVEMGTRMLVILDVLKPDLRIGLPVSLSVQLRHELRAIVDGEDALRLGRFFRKPLAWVRKCTSLVHLGKRAYSMMYVLCGDLIDSATCTTIGALGNRTRQAANKSIQDFRDNFSGIKSLPMRGNGTRMKCQKRYS